MLYNRIIGGERKEVRYALKITATFAKYRKSNALRDTKPIRFRRIGEYIVFTEPVIELDIYTYLRRESAFVRNDELEDIRLLIPTAGKSVTIAVKPSLQTHGKRMHFLCFYCKRQVQKLYVHPNRYDHQRKMWIVACRNCHGLRYSSQYKKDSISKRVVAEYKLSRLESQKRRYWHGDEPTQFGRRYQKLREETKTFWEMLAEMGLLAPSTSQNLNYRN